MKANIEFFTRHYVAWLPFSLDQLPAGDQNYFVDKMVQYAEKHPHKGARILQKQNRLFKQHFAISQLTYKPLKSENAWATSERQLWHD